ncbi:MAG: hypothetical protein SPI65_06010 [Peptoniphilus sp.]|nr:hypothetical protein [Peptoniphilus sp.]MDY6045112.1 hypothetical protein [Peptoniphilus sp.]
MNILYICTGNTCRSPMAKLLTEREADRLGKDINVRSRGLAARDGESMSMGALKVLAEEGINATFHSAKTVTDEDFAWADKVYGMTRTMTANLKRGWPQYADKIEPFAEKDVVDPFGGSMALYRVTRDDLLKEIERKLKEEL